jgi:hypothetical protein
MNVKRAIILLLAVGLMVAVAGCARWPGEPEPEPSEPEYQLEITVEVAGEINVDEGIYYIVLDVDGNSATGPEYDISFWDDDFYYVKLENYFFYFAKVEEGSPELDLTDYSYSENELQVTIALSDLEDPSSVDINILTTDSENNSYDHLDSYFTINTDLGSTEEGIVSEGGSEEGGADFDIVSVTAVITTLY